MKTIKTIPLLLLFALSTTSCYKIKSFKKIKVNVKVINPVTGAVYPNIPWSIIEAKKDLKVFSSNSHVFMEGVTDQNGEAHIEFKKPMGNKWVYALELTGVDSYPYKWSIDNDKIYDFTAYKSAKVNFVLHIKNTNCFDANDKAVYKFTNGIYTKKPYGSFSSYPYDGCANLYYGAIHNEDLYPYTLEVTRNGVTTTTYDTLVIKQGLDTLNFFY